MELYNTYIQNTIDMLGTPSQKWAYSERDAWKDNGASELVLLRDAAYELGGSGKAAVNFTAITTSTDLIPADEVMLYGPDLKEMHFGKGGMKKPNHKK